MVDLQTVIDAAGSRAELARKLAISYEAVRKWTRVPPERCIAVETITGIPREQLRPDIYPPKSEAVA